MVSTSEIISRESLPRTHSLAVSFNDITLAFIGALMGLVVSLPVTYLVVDRIVDRNAKKRMEPVKKMAKERLASKLGVGSLTTMLITLVIDVRSTLDENRPLDREVSELTIAKLKSYQTDLEIMLGIYNNVLSVDLSHLTGSVISQIEHLQEDVQFMIEILPRPPSKTQVSHIEHVILSAVHLVNQALLALGADDTQTEALESWLKEYAGKREHSADEEPIKVSGKHVIR